MQIFEFLFNPLPRRSPSPFIRRVRRIGRSARQKKIQQSSIFDSFIFEPENIDEKKLGYLCIIGQLTNALPKSNLLENLTQIIKNKYYSYPVKPMPEKALKESLKKANKFLSEMAHKGNVAWLGNLNLTILCLGLNSPTNSIELNFTKAGDHKLFLLRGKQTIDISHDVELQNIDPYPPKAFGNIISGQLNRGDRLLVLSKDIFSVFDKAYKKGGQNLFSHLAKVSDFSEKSIKKVLKSREKELSETSGICLAIDLSEKSLSEKLRLPIIVQKPKKAKLLKVLVSEKINNFKKSVSSRISIKLLTSLKRKKKEKKKVSKKYSRFSKIFNFLTPKKSISLLKNKFRRFIPSPKKIELITRKKNIILICGFIFILAFGFMILDKQTQKENQKIQETLMNAQTKIDQAESALIIKDENLANKFLLEAWQMVFPLAEEKRKNKELAIVKEKIESELNKLNKRAEIKEQELFVELNTDFNPQRFISNGNNFYFYNPGSNKVYETKTGRTLEAPQNIKFAVLLGSSVLFFLENNNLIILSENQWSSEINIDKPFAGFTCDEFASYNSNLYCLNKEKEQIIKYNHFTNLLWGSAKNWLKSQQDLSKAKSMIIDGSIWVLNQNNSIDRYRLAAHQETIDINTFPIIENITKIKTSSTLPYLYLLEPSQNRIIILTKAGEIYKQIFSEKFDDLKDFEISADGKTIWLLNENNIFQIKL